MTRPSIVLTMVSGLILTGPAVAAELAPQSGYSVHLAGLDGTVYYTAEAEGFRVVATMASKEGSPVRFISTLMSGQRIIISIPQAADQPSVDFEILRDGDILTLGGPVTAVTANLAGPTPAQVGVGN